MKKFTNRGFTLIELLVVIAVIGILSSIVLVSLSGARDKAKDARIKADLTQIRSTAELIYDDDSQYDALCAIDNTLDEVHATYGNEIGIVETDIDTQNGTTGGVPACYATGDDYCISATDTSGADVCISAAGEVGNDACAAANTACTP